MVCDYVMNYEMNYVMNYEMTGHRNVMVWSEYEVSDELYGDSCN